MDDLSSAPSSSFNHRTVAAGKLLQNQHYHHHHQPRLHWEKSTQRRMTMKTRQQTTDLNQRTPTKTTTTTAKATKMLPVVAPTTTMRRQQQPQVFACHKFKRATSQMMSSSRMKAAKGSLGPLSTRPLLGFGAGNVWATTTLLSILALITLLSASAFKTTEAIKLQPEGREKFNWSGEQFVITCQNNNNIKNVKIRWIGPNGMDITEDRSQRVHAESTGPHGHRLVVMNATASTDDGQYKCTLGSTDDRNPREHIEFNLKLYKTTSFKDTTRHLVLPTGQQGTLNCKVEFDPSVQSASVSWVRDQRPIEMFNDSSYTVVEYDSSRQLSQLIISPLTKQHEGVYTCRAVAVTSQLSKISDHDIQLETNYAPTFDKDSHTVWVERSQSLVQRQQQQSQPQQQYPANVYGPAHAGSVQQTGGRPNHQFQTVRSRHNKQHYPNGSLTSMMQANRRVEGEMDPQLQQHQQQQQQQGSNSTNSSSLEPHIVRVELRCTCQANPAASILWTSTQSSMYVLSQGVPAHVLEEPTYETDGHNSTSVLVIGYNLDVDWAHRRDSYICSASNKLGKAAKTFTIEQGDPPPAFNVGPHKQYDPQSSFFKFTLLGPNFDPEGGAGQYQNHHHQQQHQQEILPVVDSFRIRAENPAGASDSKPSYWSRNSNKQNEPSVQWSLTQQQHQQMDSNSRANHLNMPQNFTVSLSKLPSGNQKLYLEAHNAVGWSPNATYLGDYYIVSGASGSFPRFNGTNIIQLILSLLVSFSILISILRGRKI